MAKILDNPVEAVLSPIKIQTKTLAIESKDAKEIVAQSVYIPFMGVAKDVAVVQAWLDKRKTILQNTVSTLQAKNSIELLKSVLCEDCKKYLIDGSSKPELKPCAVDYDNICAIILYEFSIGLR